MVLHQQDAGCGPGFELVGEVHETLEHGVVSRQISGISFACFELESQERCEHIADLDDLAGILAIALIVELDTTEISSVSSLAINNRSSTRIDPIRFEAIEFIQNLSSELVDPVESIRHELHGTQGHPSPLTIEAILGHGSVAPDDDTGPGSIDTLCRSFDGRLCGGAPPPKALAVQGAVEYDRLRDHRPRACSVTSSSTPLPARPTVRRRVEADEQAWSPDAVHILGKPTGAICNWDAATASSWTKRRCTRVIVSACPTNSPRPTSGHWSRHTVYPQVTVAWQGGEPTLMGLGFYRKTIELEERYRQPGMSFLNTLQTNGTLLTDEWCEFFAMAS